MIKEAYTQSADFSLWKSEWQLRLPATSREDLRWHSEEWSVEHVGRKEALRKGKHRLRVASMRIDIGADRLCGGIVWVAVDGN